MVFFVCMYIFSIFSLPLSFCVLVYALYPATERREAGGMWLRGFAISLPLVFVARAAGALVPSMYGTILSPLHEAADRFLPFILIPGAVYTLFRHRLGCRGRWTGEAKAHRLLLRRTVPVRVLGSIPHGGGPFRLRAVRASLPDIFDNDRGSAPLGGFRSSGSPSPPAPALLTHSRARSRGE